MEAALITLIGGEADMQRHAVPEHTGHLYQVPVMDRTKPLSQRQMIAEYMVFPLPGPSADGRRHLIGVWNGTVEWPT